MEVFPKTFVHGTVLLIILMWINKSGVSAVDNFGLLFGSLRTFQAHACDGDELTLNCSSNTVISINFVRYGRAAGRDDLCPGRGTADAPSCEVKSALQVIEQKCRGQVLCRLLMSPDMFHEDSCPGVRKYAEVAYKCKPESFLNKVVCEGDHLYLTCPGGQSIAIYSAFYGTSLAEVPECRQPVGVEIADCQLSYATENVARLCNGLPRCALWADLSTFEDIRRTVPFRCRGRKHLKVTYSCVQSNLLNKPRGSEKTSQETIQTTSFPAWVRSYDKPLLAKKQDPVIIRSPTSPSNLFRSEMQSDEMPSDDQQQDSGQTDGKSAVGFMSGLLAAQKYISTHKDELILYSSLVAGVAFVFLLTVVFARLLVRRSSVRRGSRDQAAAKQVVDSDQLFGDSDVEDPLQAPATLNYVSSLRRQSSDVQPRTPISSELNHYFS